MQIFPALEILFLYLDKTFKNVSKGVAELIPFRDSPNVRNMEATKGLKESTWGEDSANQKQEVFNLSRDVSEDATCSEDCSVEEEASGV